MRKILRSLVRKFQGRPEGPRLIVGSADHDSVKIWGRGSAQGSHMEVEARGPGGEIVRDQVQLSEDSGYTGVVELEELSADTPYQLSVSFGDGLEPESGAFRTFPKVGSEAPTNFILNSCAFAGVGPWRNSSVAMERREELAQGVDFVLHAGDQVYADRIFPAYTVEEFRAKYAGAWSADAAKGTLGHQVNFMIHDDHAVTDNYTTDGEVSGLQHFLVKLLHGVEGEEQFRGIEANGFQVCDEFQSSHGPQTYGSSNRYYNFSHGKHRFFVLDTRSESNRKAKQMISGEQMTALFEWVKEHPEDPKFIVSTSPFLQEMGNPEGKWYAPEFAKQREEIIDFLANNEIDNVAFLAGDVHASYHAVTQVTSSSGKSLEWHELASSPLNAGTMRRREKFLSESEGTTSGGTYYRTSLDEESFLSRDGTLPFSIKNSNLMKIQVDGDHLKWESYRSRTQDSEPARQGSFQV